MPCINSASELVRSQSGTGTIAFGFQLRPVGHNRDQGSELANLRFKDFVFITNMAGLKLMPKIQRTFLLRALPDFAVC